MKMQIGCAGKALLIRSAVCLVLAITGILLFCFPTKAAARRDQRTLTFAERVACQRAIEEVYWRHQIWPKERPDTKPSLDAVMSEVELNETVTDYLGKSRGWSTTLSARSPGAVTG